MGQKATFGRINVSVQYRIWTDEYAAICLLVRRYQVKRTLKAPEVFLWERLLLFRRLFRDCGYKRGSNNRTLIRPLWANKRPRRKALSEEGFCPDASSLYARGRRDPRSGAYDGYVAAYRSSRRRG